MSLSWLQISLSVPATKIPIASWVKYIPGVHSLIKPLNVLDSRDHTIYFRPMTDC